MKDRRLARRLALDVLYEAEMKSVLASEVLALREQIGWLVSDAQGETAALSPDAQAYAEVLVWGVQDHQAQIDGLLSRVADRWSVERMPIVDRNVLRLATFELLWREDVPTAVAINEAVDLAKSMSTDDSGRFVNGILGRVAEQRTTGERR